MRSLLLASLLTLATPVAASSDVPLTWEIKPHCTADTLEVSFVPPNTLSFRSTLSCHGTPCVEEWIIVEGKRIGAKSTCVPPSSLSSPPQP